MNREKKQQQKRDGKPLSEGRRDIEASRQKSDREWVESLADE